jgi:hypothetical protein
VRQDRQLHRRAFSLALMFRRWRSPPGRCRVGLRLPLSHRRDRSIVEDKLYRCPRSDGLEAIRREHANEHPRTRIHSTEPFGLNAHKTNGNCILSSSSQVFSISRRWFLVRLVSSSMASFLNWKYGVS